MSRSNAYFWDSLSDSFRQFFPWNLIKSSTGIGLNEEKKTIYIFTDGHRFDYRYNSEEDAKHNLNRLFEELILFNPPMINDTIITKVNMMWNAPGMPGYMMACQSFTDQVGQ